MKKKFKIGNYLAPLTIALFANSPFNEKKLSGFLSYRGKVWQETNRGGIMPITFENVHFEKYIDHAINYPLLFLKKNGKYYSPNGQTFRDFLNGKLSFSLIFEANFVSLLVNGISSIYSPSGT